MKCRHCGEELSDAYADACPAGSKCSESRWTAIVQAKQADTTFSSDDKRSLEHALMHLESNNIYLPTKCGGWYCGNKNDFIKQHIKAIDLLRHMIGLPNAPDNRGA